jgi:hypothetical protein
VFEQPEKISKVWEVIEMDVQRSHESMHNIDAKKLASVLKAYAFYNPEVEYSQGMNYVAGFLLSVLKEEELAFKALHAVMVKSQMAQLFNSDLPKLKLFFMWVDRLLQMK